MAEEFLSDSANSNPPDASGAVSRGDREPVRLMAIGSRQGIQFIIHRLHNLRFVKANEWSTIQPERKTGQFMSVVTKYIRVE